MNEGTGMGFEKQAVIILTCGLSTLVEVSTSDTVIDVKFKSCLV